jgi:hypothetical protein
MIAQWSFLSPRFRNSAWTAAAILPVDARELALDPGISLGCEVSAWVDGQGGGSLLLRFADKSTSLSWLDRFDSAPATEE